MDKKDYYPEDWEDDVTMNFMFSTFRANRDVNPRSWDSKMDFWSELIITESKHSNLAMIDSRTLPDRFKRKEKNPQCINHVLINLHRSGKIQSLNEFETSAAGWVVWGAKLLLKPLSWSFGKLLGSDELQNVYVVPEIIKAKASAVLERHYSNVTNELTDNMVEYSQLAERCEDICRDQQELRLVVLQLTRDKKATVIQGKSGETLVRFTGRNTSNVEPSGEVEEKILCLRKSEEQLKRDIVEYHQQLEALRVEAKGYLERGMKIQAKGCLRQKRSLEKKIEERENSLETLQTMMDRIRETGSTKMILAAYEAGSSAYRDLTAGQGLTPENCEDVIVGLQEMHDLQADLEASMSLPADVISGEPSQEELLAELDQLMAEEDLDFPPDLGLPPVPDTDPASHLLPAAGKPAPPRTSRAAQPVGFNAAPWYPPGPQSKSPARVRPQSKSPSRVVRPAEMFP